ncbi:metalloregulator ArsR/SmtB family transcription factor [Glycomyces scopariae]|uniref:DNA-binding transcriptional regulator, ArsR family n=1 Tax=Glycomyces sambucus TaxID=380244 RepID=A0A1G9EZM2_9ACTN|nr:metalloregulator ArsR/SmtB family transcription factor [Glycomyces sambucus]SDK81639.1 DNA-binding transcriptional regulator, ArsR family [Glycomyces sambucus]
MVVSSIFEVLALPVRQAIVERLREGPRTVGELAEGLGLSQPLASKHLRVLRDSGFVSVRAEAQRRWYELRPEPLREVDRWLEPYRWMWESRLDRLGDRLDAMAAEEDAAAAPATETATDEEKDR